MERKVPFVEGEIYHVYSRGVEKRVIFTTEEDRERFLNLLLLCNNTKPVKLGNSRPQRGFPSLVGDETDTLTDIAMYALMPNHIHLALKEKREGGISKFMLKLMTAYSMYFNKKYERSGPLFTRPFRSTHIDSDEYLRWLFAYVHLNPLALYQHDWKEHGLRDLTGAGTFLRTYRYSSFPDYVAIRRPESSIVSIDAMPISRRPVSVDELLHALSADGRHASPFAVGEKRLV